MGMSNGSVQSPYEKIRQSTFFWGCAGAVLAIVITVIAAMAHDIRWLLWFAWPFAAFAIWEFSRTWSLARNIVWAITGIGTILVGLLLLCLYMALAPIENLAKTPPEITTEYAGLSNSQLRNVVFAHAASMRSLDENYRNKQSEIDNRYQRQYTSQEDMRKSLSEMKLKDSMNRNEEVTNFHNNFLSTSRALHAELLRRLGLEYPNALGVSGTKDISHNIAVMLLDTGFVAGPQPISDLANYLEDLSKKLP